MDSHKVSVTSENRDGRRMIDVTTGSLSFSFDSSRVLIDIWKSAIVSLPSTWRIELLTEGMWDISELYLDADRLTLEISRYCDDDSGSGIYLQIELPSSITLSLLTQVIDELAKYQVEPASE
jgi:hypothetical protein